MQKTAIEPEINTSIKMEVGIEDCLHIEFEYNKSKCVSRSSPLLVDLDWHLLTVNAAGACRYHLKDVVLGKIFFLLVRIKIKHMELAIIRRESTGSGEPAPPPLFSPEALCPPTPRESSA